MLELSAEVNLSGLSPGPTLLRLITVVTSDLPGPVSLISGSSVVTSVAAVVGPCAKSPSVWAAAAVAIMATAEITAARFMLLGLLFHLKFT
jgi:hypothetical protein